MQHQRGTLLITVALVLSAGALGFAAADQQQGEARDARLQSSNYLIRNGELVRTGTPQRIANPAADRQMMIAQLKALNDRVDRLQRVVDSLEKYQRQTYVLLANRLPQAEEPPAQEPARDE